ncbi:MAG: geranylgeranyl reductase, partial [Marivirga sp.]|nr:geranylgeranyl reductase [Marivirga sp.]
MQEKEFDVLIVGSGPAGAVTAMELGKAGLSVAILDKATFPRDKTCGDALSVDVVNQLSILSENLASSFDKFPGKVSSYGVKIFSPDNKHVDIPFKHDGDKKCGYICKRFDFDNLLVQQLKEFSSVKAISSCTVQRIETSEKHNLIHTPEGVFKASIVIGADGAQSIVSKSLGTYKPDRKHYSGGLRIYYEGVSRFHEDHFIELYFFRQILPGYLWIFPLPDNKANVGIGMLSSEISKKKINLTKTLKELLANHPLLKERFADAKPIETVKGYGLPLGSLKRKISGERFLLVGDAASLIDPFTGEGIGN